MAYVFYATASGDVVLRAAGPDRCQLGTPPEAQEPIVAGINVSKDKLDLHLWPIRTDASFDNTPADIDKLIKRIAKQPVRLTLGPVLA